MKIVIADEDPQILRALRVVLAARGFEIMTAAGSRQAVNAPLDSQPELIVLDLGLPELRVIELIEAVRVWSTLPIFVVLQPSESADVDASDAGSVDYVAKPIVDEIFARLREPIRDVPTASREATVALGDVTVDLANHLVTKGASPVRLTPTEWRMLEVLVRNPNRLIMKEELLRDARGPQHTNDRGYLRLYISQLRKKLEPEPANPRFLLTETGMGYRFFPGGG